MTFFLFLGLLVTVHSCWSVPLATEVSQASLALSSPSCSDSSVLAAAGFALQDINADREEGYMFSLNRVADVREHYQDGLSFVYYLTLDVLETTCHVLSKKKIKNCPVRDLHNAVYGQCKAIFYMNMPQRILYLPAYNCTVRPVSRLAITTICPDCPMPITINISDSGISEAVHASLEKINKEVAVGKKLYLFQVTKAYFQWVIGPSYFLEYLVTEEPDVCTKSLPPECWLAPDAKPVGLCKGSLIRTHSEDYVTGSCEFFPTQSTSAAGSHPPEHQFPQQQAFPSMATPQQAGPKGSVQFLPDRIISKEDLSIPVQEEFPGRLDFPVHLNLTRDSLGQVLHIPSAVPLEKEAVVLPFPEGPRSNECPGPAKNPNRVILPP